MSVPLVFKSISMRNLLSFGNQESVIELDGQGTVTVTGENLDQGGSNGAGKTTIINAICYALYNKPFDNIGLQRLINSTNATKNTQMEVRLVFDKDNNEYEIYRARGEEYTIQLKRNGEDITPGKGVTECDNLILDVIGISYDLFTKTIIFSGNSPAFLQLPIAQQRKQIEELFNITMLSEKAQQLKENIRTTEQDIKVAEAVIKQQEVAVELHKKHIREANQRVSNWEASRIAQIESLEETQALVIEIDFEAEQKLHDRRFILQQEQSLLSSKLIPLQKDHQVLSKGVSKALDELTHLEDEKCPYCLQDFAGAKEKIADLIAKLDVGGERVLELEEQILEFETAIVHNKQALIEVNSLIKHQNLNELIEAKNNVTSNNRKIEELKDAGNPYEEVRDSLLKESIKSVDYALIDNLKKKLDHQQFLLKLLTDKNSFLRQRIINKSIPFLNSRLNNYTNLLGLPHVVKFDADMSCTVAEFGRELDFGNLSAGEKKRVNTAMALAFRDVLHHLHARTNLLLIDELDGALDAPGIDSVIRILKDLSRDENTSIFIISHHPAVTGRLDRNLIIRKEQGFSSVIIEDN